MYPLIDTHAHLYSEEFDDDRPEVIRRCLEAGVSTVLLPNTSCEYIGRLRETVSMAPDLFVPMIGLEPTDVGEDWEEQLEALERELGQARGTTGVSERSDRTTTGVWSGRSR